MKVILLKDIPKVGHKYDIKDVAPGFASNSLIPQKLAEIVTPATLARVEKQKAEADMLHAKQIEALISHKQTLLKEPIVIAAKANNKGHLFAGIDASLLAEKLSLITGMDISPRIVELAHPLKEVGEHTVHVVLGEERVLISVVVEAL